MAATRLITMHQNKGKSVAKSLSDRTDYAKNGEKTENGQFISSYACQAESVDEEFMLSKREYERLIGRHPRLCHCRHQLVQEKLLSYCIEKEGGKKVYYVTRYERKPKLRKKAIEIHGTKCMACGFDFESFYGEQGKNYIEVHHVVPLSTVDEQVEVNPEKDMIVVCSNCHRMIHRRRNAVLTLDELKSMITIVE